LGLNTLYRKERLHPLYHRYGNLMSPLYLDILYLHVYKIQICMFYLQQVKIRYHWPDTLCI